LRCHQKKWQIFSASIGLNLACHAQIDANDLLLTVASLKKRVLLTNEELNQDL